MDRSKNIAEKPGRSDLSFIFKCSAFGRVQSFEVVGRRTRGGLKANGPNSQFYGGNEHRVYLSLQGLRNQYPMATSLTIFTSCGGTIMLNLKCTMGISNGCFLFLSLLE